MSEPIVPFRPINARGQRHADLVASMLMHWRAGTPDFHHVVRDEVPGCTLDEFNAAADEAWRVLAPETAGAAT